MSWLWPWRRAVERSSEAVATAEALRDRAEEQNRRLEALSPRVDAATERLQRLRTENHFGPMIEDILRGNR